MSESGISPFLKQWTAQIIGIGFVLPSMWLGPLIITAYIANHYLKYNNFLSDACEIGIWISEGIVALECTLMIPTIIYGIPVCVCEAVYLYRLKKACQKAEANQLILLYYLHTLSKNKTLMLEDINVKPKNKYDYI